MADLISRDALLDEFRSLCGPQTGDGWDNLGVRDLVMRQETVDAVPVVRCKDCKWFDCKNYVCNNDILAGRIADCGCYPNFSVEPYWFCADGERRESE